MRTALAILAAGGAVALGAASAAGDTGQAAAAAAAKAKKITPAGVGRVKLGRTFRAIRREHLVGRLRPGCELAENTRSARLKAPLRGNVNFTQSSPRRVNDITIRGGAQARGVHVGSRARAIRRAYPKARFDHSTEDVFGITLVRVPRKGGGRLEFAVNPKTHRVTLIGVPFIAFCE